MIEIESLVYKLFNLFYYISEKFNPIVAIVKEGGNYWCRYICADIYWSKYMAMVATQTEVELQSLPLAET